MTEVTEAKKEVLKFQSFKVSEFQSFKVSKFKMVAPNSASGEVPKKQKRF